MKTKHTAIEFKQITKQFPGVRALTDVSFSIEEAEIHSIVGENGAGKSTLMNILGGLFGPTEGSVLYFGETVDITNEQASLQLGIGVVYQELKLCGNLSVTENIFLGRELRTTQKRLDWVQMEAVTQQVLHSLGSSIGPRALVKSLTIAEQQIIEIAKSLARDIKVLILDEPTSALTLHESQKLFENIRELKSQGVTVIYISHRLEEILELSDRISVLRDGQYKGTFNAQDVDINRLVTLIAGQKLIGALDKKASKRPKVEEDREPTLIVNNLSSSDGRVDSVSFSLHSGEILGLYGVQGAGRTELLECLFGLRAVHSAEIYLNGKQLHITSPSQAIDEGFAMVPEDRRRSGIFPNFSIQENIAISNPRSCTKRLGWLDRKRMRSISQKLKQTIGIKTPDVDQNIMNLSGGNQQKVIIARWLETNPSIFLVDELTRGVDVGAKTEIFSVLDSLRDRGMGILLVSSEIQEVVAEADRVLVMKDGRIVKELVGDAVTKDKIIHHALIG